MKIDFTYIKIFFEVLNNKRSIDDLKQCLGYQVVQKHAKLVGNEFSVDSITKALAGVPDAGYGLYNLRDNIEDIKVLITNIKALEAYWIAELTKHVENIFPECDLTSKVICPIIGYDIGIGMDDVICLNMNTPLFFNDIREVISTSIHEMAHTITEKYQPIEFVIETKEQIKSTIDLLIQYEGIGIFAAYHYRKENDLPLTGISIIEDYHVTDESKANLFQVYNKLQKQVKDKQVSDEDALNYAFGDHRLCHRLGYALILDIYQKQGIEQVRNTALMPNKAFVDLYLR